MGASWAQPRADECPPLVYPKLTSEKARGSVAHFAGAATEPPRTQMDTPDEDELCGGDEHPRPRQSSVRLAPPCELGPIEEYEHAARHGRSREDRPRILAAPYEPLPVNEEDYFCELEFDGGDDLGESSPADLSGVYVRLLQDPTLRLTQEFCEAYRYRKVWHPFRHPAGEIVAPWEKTWDHYYERRAKESDWFRARERSILPPYSGRVLTVLGSRESVETKKSAVKEWISALARCSRPVISPSPGTLSFFGRHWSETDAAGEIRSTPEWRDHQSECAHERGDRYRETHGIHLVPLQWLKRNAKAALKPHVTSELRAKARKRLEVMGWTWAEFKKQAKERGWL